MILQMGLSALATLVAVAIMYLHSLGEFEVPVPKWLLRLMMVHSKLDVKHVNEKNAKKEKLAKTISHEQEDEKTGVIFEGSDKRRANFRHSQQSSTISASSPTKCRIRSANRTTWTTGCACASAWTPSH